MEMDRRQGVTKAYAEACAEVRMPCPPVCPFVRWEHEPLAPRMSRPLTAP